MLADRYISALMHSAQLKSRTGNWLGSLSIYRRIVQERPDFVPAYCELARLYLDRDDFDGARGVVEKALKADPQNTEAHFILGVIEYIDGNFEAALRSYRLVEGIDGLDRNLAMNIALVCEALGLQHEAIEHLQYTIARGGAGERVYGVLTDLYRALGDFTQAVRVLETAAGKFRSSASLHLDLGRAYVRMGSYAKAVIAIEKACKLAPDDIPSLDELARLYAKLDRMEDAVSPLSRLVEIDRKNVENWLRLARAYYAMGELEKSAQILEEAVQISPDNTSIKDELTYLRGKLCQSEEAPGDRSGKKKDD